MGAEKARGPRARLRRWETWLWMGPLGHLLGGALDFARALARYLLVRARRRRTSDSEPAERR
jgi:hypothetical protein